MLRTALGRYGGAVTVLCLIAITVASLSPRESLGDPGSADKTAHVLAFMAATLPAAASRIPLWIVAAGILAWGGAIELLQPLVGRTAGLSDMAANAAGVAMGAILGVVVRRALRHDRD